MALSAMETMFGKSLMSKDNTVQTSDVLADVDVVMIYFSAHWCGPCRGFTPKLSEAYTMMKKTGKKIEVVFASSDRDQTSFDEYYGEMPWLALPYPERQAKDKLSKEYKVRGIPSLVFVNAKDGSLITTDGREEIMKDPTGKNFPWTPKTLKALLGNEFTVGGGAGSMVDGSGMKDKYLGLYFSAHWCPPCKMFTPSLASTYTKMKENGTLDKFEIIFVSSDRDNTAFTEYHNEMPWLALPFAKRAEKEALSSNFGVLGIPTLVILGPENGDGGRDVINADGRSALSGDPEGAKFPWFPPLVPALGECSGINETPTLIILADKCDTAIAKKLRKAMEVVAEEKKASGDTSIGFSIAEPGDDLADRMRHLITPKDAPGAEETNTSPVAFLIDVDDDGALYRLSEEITEASLRAALTGFKSKMLEKHRLNF